MLPKSIPSTVLLAAVALLLWAGPASAACQLECKAVLVRADCSLPPTGAYANDQTLRLTVACSECCQASGAPAPTCTATVVDLSPKLLIQPGNVVPGSFVASGVACSGTPRLDFDNGAGGKLTAGFYQITSSKLATPLVEFQVTQEGKSCTTPGECGSCLQCNQGLCFAPCTGDADCGEGNTCLIAAVSPSCNNACMTGKPACGSNGDCGPCEFCSGGKCVNPNTPPVCSSDAQCAAGQSCSVKPDAQCQNACVSKPKPQCVANSECATCEVCNAGVCYLPAMAAACTSDAQCPAGTTCSVKPAAPCLNACVVKGKDCNNDNDCGGCGTCVGGKCSAVATGCSDDGQCGSGQQCLADPQSACNHLCGFKGCAVDADCPSCVTCLAGKCSGMGTVACTVDGDCGAGKNCKKDAVSPCANVCVVTGCKLDGDCGPCGLCTSGVCSQLPAPCNENSGCGAKESCQLVAGATCQNACIPIAEPADAGPPFVADAGASDSTVEPADTAAKLDTGPTDSGAAPADAGVQLDVSDAAKLDTGAGTDATAPEDVAVDAGEVSGADAGTEDDAIDDTEPEETPAAVPARTSSCTAGAAGSGFAALAWLLALAGVTVLLRRRSV